MRMVTGMYQLIHKNETQPKQFKQQTSTLHIWHTHSQGFMWIVFKRNQLVIVPQALPFLFWYSHSMEK